MEMKDSDFKAEIGSDKKLSRGSLRHWKSEWKRSNKGESPREFYIRVTDFFKRIMPHY